HLNEESVPVVDATLSTSGTITFQDLDLIDTHSATFVLTSSSADANLPGFIEGTTGETNIGTFAIDASVSEDNSDTVNTGSLGWTFTLDDSNPVLQSLAVGQVLTQVYTVTLDDHHGGTISQPVTITITGTNDGPTITSDASAHAGSVTEDSTHLNEESVPVVDATLSTSGTITFQDLDLIDTHSATFVLTSSSADANLPGFIEGTTGETNIGTFAIDASVSEDNSDTV